MRVQGVSLPVSPALSVGGPARQAGGALNLAENDLTQQLEHLLERLLQQAAAESGGVVLAGAGARALADAGVGEPVATTFFADGHVQTRRAFAWDAALAPALRQLGGPAPLRSPAALPQPVTPSGDMRFALPQESAVPGSRSVGAVGAAGATAAVAAAEAAAEQAQPTGLVVQARGLAVQPCLLPQLVDAAGHICFGAMHVMPAALQNVGVARYSRSLDAALQQPRLGARPALVRAHEVAAQNACALVLDARQAATVRHAAQARAAGAVTIVID
jgi:hypothetical protein